jgi:hypothetical protein
MKTGLPELGGALCVCALASCIVLADDVWT